MNARVRKHTHKQRQTIGFRSALRVYIQHWLRLAQLNLMFIVVFSHSISPAYGLLWAITIANEHPNPIFIVQPAELAQKMSESVHHKVESESVIEFAM